MCFWFFFLIFFKHTCNRSAFELSGNDGRVGQPPRVPCSCPQGGRLEGRELQSGRGGESGGERRPAEAVPLPHASSARLVSSSRNPYRWVSSSAVIIITFVFILIPRLLITKNQTPFFIITYMCWIDWGKILFNRWYWMILVCVVLHKM